MCEQVKGSDYQRIQHFISDSPWDDRKVLSKVSVDISELMNKGVAGDQEVGLLLDESGHKKSGKMSVGVARQYLGSIGKTDTGQVGVFAALVKGNHVSLLDSRLYLPEVWCSNPSRCQKAGIPPEKRGYKTKPELALEMIKELPDGVTYDWVGGDSIYGNSKELRRGLDQKGITYLMDISANLNVYLSDPCPYIPEIPLLKGRRHTNYISDLQSVNIKELIKEIRDDDWKEVQVRKGTKGFISRKVFTKQVYIWPSKRAKNSYREKVKLVISTHLDGSELKVSLTNDLDADHTVLIYRQVQRYWVERAFQDAKDAIGMTQYQVRGWRAWHHHITLTIMALHYILIQKVQHQKDLPLLSCHDIKFYMALNLPNKTEDKNSVWDIIERRHQQRFKDINRFT